MINFNGNGWDMTLLALLANLGCSRRSVHREIRKLLNQSSSRFLQKWPVLFLYIHGNSRFPLKENMHFYYEILADGKESLISLIQPENVFRDDKEVEDYLGRLGERLGFSYKKITFL
jgi:hypothetical protein